MLAFHRQPLRPTRSMLLWSTGSPLSRLVSGTLNPNEIRLKCPNLPGRVSDLGQHLKARPFQITSVTISRP